MGTYRYLLAAAVVLSHGLVTWNGYNIGAVAVISFFCISGFVMSALIATHYPTPAKVGHFYLDRLLRIYPQYLFYFLITAALYYNGKVVNQDFLAGVTKYTAFLNGLIVPLGYPDSFQVYLRNAMFIPQAWSLGLELTFYLIVPALVLFAGNRLTRGIALASCLVATMAAFGYITTSTYGYSTLPGTLFVFMLGIEIHRKRDPALRWGLTAFLVVMYAIVLSKPELAALHWSKEVYLGGIIASIMVPWLAGIKFVKWGTATTPKEKMSEAAGRFDAAMGFISYGLFLNHFIFIWLLRTHTPLGHWETLSQDHLVIVLLAGTGAAWFTYKLIDEPITNLRAWLRKSNWLERRMGRGGIPEPAEQLPG